MCTTGVQSTASTLVWATLASHRRCELVCFAFAWISFSSGLCVSNISCSEEEHAPVVMTQAFFSHTGVWRGLEQLPKVPHQRWRAGGAAGHVCDVWHEAPQDLDARYRQGEYDSRRTACLRVS